jgi:hypothetical protein
MRTMRCFTCSLHSELHTITLTSLRGKACNKTLREHCMQRIAILNLHTASFADCKEWKILSGGICASWVQCRIKNVKLMLPCTRSLQISHSSDARMWDGSALPMTGAARYGKVAAVVDENSSARSRSDKRKTVGKNCSCASM